MKRILILCLLLLCLVPLASADFQLLNRGAYEGATAGGINITVPYSRDELCSAYGKTSYQGQTDLNFYYADAANIPPTGYANLTIMSSQDTLYKGSVFTLQTNTTSNGAYIIIGESCNDLNWYSLSYWTYYRYPALLPAPIANFTGTPTSGSSPLTVSFTDTSTNAIAPYNWSVSPAPGVSIDTPAAANTLMHFPAVGNYTISHGVSSYDARSNISTKIDYIRAYNSTSDYTTTGFAAMDEPRWIQLAGATINLHDIENNTWKNTTASTLGYAEITTLSNHTISAYASMTGYADADLLNKPAWSNGVYPILMFPTGYGNVSKGNITLYVNVWANSARLPGATVNMAYNDGITQFNDYRVTGLSGTATFVVPNKTTIYLYGEKAGYSRSGTTINSGTGDGGSASVTADITLTQGTITPTATITTLPGGGTPTPIQTEDPYPCDADHPENCQRKETEMGNSLVAWGPSLISLFILLTFVGGLKLMGK